MLVHLFRVGIRGGHVPGRPLLPHRFQTFSAVRSTDSPGSCLLRAVAQLRFQLRARLPQASSRPRRSPTAWRWAGGVLLGPGALSLCPRLYLVALCEPEEALPARPQPCALEARFNWKLFWQFLQPHLLILGAAIVMALGAALVNVQIPLLLGQLVEIVAKYTRQRVGSFLTESRNISSHLLLLYGLQGLLTFGYLVLLSRVGERMAVDMRRNLFSNLLRQDIAFFDATKTGQLVSRLTADVQEFKSSFKLVISQVSAHAPSGEAAARSGKRRESCPGARSDRPSALLTSCPLAGPPTPRPQTGALPALRARPRATPPALAREAGHADSPHAVAGPPGDPDLSPSMANLSVLFGQVVRGLSAGARVFEYMTLCPGIPLSGGCRVPKEHLRGSVAFQNVSFSYPCRPGFPVLRDFTLTLPPGKMVALVGQSGGGKTTVASLLERFYDPTAGAVRLDGQDLRTLDPSWLRGQVIGFISQEPVLFATTIMENIRFGKPDASDEEVYAAAREANAHQFICSFPEGYNTVVGERGTTLSGGQKQRLAIARALIKQPVVLILDEATSALDSESERVVQEALDRASAGRTVLVIAHRLSTVRGAHHIVVMADGRICEMGTHEELLRKGGLYADLIQRQALDAPAPGRPGGPRSRHPKS
ncbi:PREDICTED: ATP-binding cassette sub-family B member 8, mitochondrial [Condylura cristata]|uniref:ATP-binding cassette sub-family B member 8, mitochondrial n=1 Tax=Condylura cristata TaxID=143302 RepID=UPI000642BEF1|nr:PREDICTED: ATP-binding cassette sub-family B member 8, mitochondrial [Condylura cristata]